MRKFIEYAQQICAPPPRRILYVYSIWQKEYEKMNGVEFIQGIPENFLDQFDGNTPTWIILDDVMQDAVNSAETADLFTKGSHHLNLSVFILVQNLYKQGKFARDITNNLHYLCLFKNPGNKAVIMNFARDFAPGKTKQFIREYERATEHPYQFLFVDMKPETPNELRLTSNIFAEPPIGVIRVHVI